MESGKRKVEKGQLALFLEEEEQKTAPLTIETLLDLWHRSFIIEGYASKTDADNARVRGEKLMRHFFTWWSVHQRDVVAIEQGFTVTLPGSTEYSIRGRFDRIEKDKDTEGLHVIDFKTGSLRTQEETDADLQLSMYAIAAEQIFAMPCTRLTLLFLREDGVEEVHTTRSEDHKHKASKNIHVLATGIDDRDFAPTPSKKKCTHCPYRGICDAAILS